VAWRVEVTGEFADWARSLRKLDRDSSRQVGAAVELLKQHGPSLKRPLVGEIATSKIKNMKELRPGDWRGWYRKAIPRAEQLYAEHIEAMSSGEAGDR
jgi:hypothetical protein